MPAGQPWGLFGTVFVSRSPVSTHYGLLNPKSAAAAFAFTASSTVSLYSSLKAGHLNHRHKTKTYQSFRTLLVVSAITSFALILPLVFFRSAPFSEVSPPHPILMFLLQFSKFSAQDNARTFPRPLRAALHASTLVLTLPQILVKTPTIPLPFRSRHVTHASVSHLVSAVVIFAFAVAKPGFFSVLSNVILVLTLVGTYLLPGNVPPLTLLGRLAKPVLQPRSTSYCTTSENHCRSSCHRNREPRTSRSPARL